LVEFFLGHKYSEWPKLEEAKLGNDVKLQHDKKVEEIRRICPLRKMRKILRLKML
jgi:hypothetical protein